MQRSENDAWKYLEERFGVKKEELGEYRLERGSGDFWLVSDVEGGDVEVETRGFRFLRDQRTGFKPTTYALQFLDTAISRNRISLDRGVLASLLDGETREVQHGDGYVAMACGGRVVGCGRVRGGVLASVIPSGRAEELASILSR